MLAHVLAATDGSDASDRLAECVLGLRRVGSTLVVLGHVFDPRDGFDGQERTLRQAGFDVVVETPLGFPSEELNRLGDEYAASLLVVGGFVRELFLGGVAHTLAHIAPLPVLFVPTPR